MANPEGIYPVYFLRSHPKTWCKFPIWIPLKIDLQAILMNMTQFHEKSSENVD